MRINCMQVTVFYSINHPRRLLNFWTLRVGAYLRWALIWCRALIKLSTFSASVVCLFCNKTINGNNKKQGFCKRLWRKLHLRGSLLLLLIQFFYGGRGKGGGVGLVLIRGWALNNFFLPLGWVLIRINTVIVSNDMCSSKLSLKVIYTLWEAYYNPSV